MSKVIFSGIQPSGELHIGNYFGAIKNWLELQKQESLCYFCVVDLHAITIDYDPKQFQDKILDTIATYLACGIDPEKSIIFVQSKVKEHAELAWLLNTITPISELERMTQYKDKRAQHIKNVNIGLLDYPVLQAADILLYNTNIVPVGQDQKQHIELARTIANKFNTKFGKTLTIPEHFIPEVGAKIMSLLEPTKKMSKSHNPKSYISLSDSKEHIEKKIMSAVTDSDNKIFFDPEKKPAISNLLSIYHLATGWTLQQIQDKYKDSTSYAQFKKDLAENIIKLLQPIQDKKQELLKDETKLLEILDNSTKKAQTEATKTMLIVKKKMGLI
ncbi:MAG: tryptophan--tRNA ligase [Patescibacteria group bacterium]|jgi:tryptophanyl-tRNA synthetase